jgi:hypothetical protein
VSVELADKFVDDIVAIFRGDHWTFSHFPGNFRSHQVDETASERTQAG